MHLFRGCSNQESWMRNWDILCRMCCSQNLFWIRNPPTFPRLVLELVAHLWVWRCSVHTAGNLGTRSSSAFRLDREAAVGSRMAGCLGSRVVGIRRYHNPPPPLTVRRKAGLLCLGLWALGMKMEPGVLDCVIYKPQWSWGSCLQLLGLFQMKFIILVLLK